MRAIVAHSARPRISRIQSSLLTGSNVCSRKTTFSPLRRRLTISDAFTILLAPILTAAFVADIVNKDKRRQLWDQKIAQIQKEIEELREKEVQAWAALQMRPMQLGTFGQRRTYSTTSTATQVQSAQDDVDNNATSTEGSKLTLTKTSGTNVVPSAMLQRFENLVATKVGLQLLLHISTGRHPWPQITTDGFSDTMVVPDNMDTLLERLAQVNTALQGLEPRLSNTSLEPSAGTIGPQQLDVELSKLTWECRTGSINMVDLIYGYTQAVMKSQTGPSLDTYQNLVETFSTLGATSLTFIAMFPFMRSKQVLSDRHISNLILQYGKVKDPRRLDVFLHRLAWPDRGFEVATAWEIVVSGGVRIPAPVNRRPRILDALIRAALQGDQPHKARAWATLLMENPASTRRLAALFNNFLNYCARHFNWADGRLWVQRTIAWSALFAQDSPWMLSRVVFRVLDVCYSCNQHDQYDMILDAAVSAGINIPEKDGTRPDAFSDLARIIREDWSSRIKKNHIQRVQEAVETATAFQHEIAQVDTAIQSFVGVVDISRLMDLLHKDAMTTLLYIDSPIRSEGQVIEEVQTAPNLYNYEPLNERVGQKSFDEHSEAPAATNGKDKGYSSLQKRLSILQDAHVRLMQRYDEQREINHRLRVETDEQPSASDNLRNFTELQESILLQDDIQRENQELQESNSQLRELNSQVQQRNLQLQNDINDLKVRNAKIITRLDASQMQERNLTQTADRLQSQLDAFNSKSLEAVFLEKENKNLRNESKNLSERYLFVLHEKENVQKDLVALQVLRDKLEGKRASDLHLLRQENENLLLRMQATKARYHKLEDTTASELNLLRQENENLLLRMQATKARYLELEDTAASELNLLRRENENLLRLLQSSNAKYDKLEVKRASDLHASREERDRLISRMRSERAWYRNVEGKRALNLQLLQQENKNLVSQMQAADARYHELKGKRALDSWDLRQDNESLLSQMQATNARYHQLLRASKSREESLQTTIDASSERIKDLESELTRWQSLDMQSSPTTDD